MSVRLVPKTKSVGQVQMSNGSWMDMLRWGVFMPAGVVIRGDLVYYNESIGDPTSHCAMKVKSVKVCEACAMAGEAMIVASPRVLSEIGHGLVRGNR